MPASDAGSGLAEALNTSSSDAHTAFVAAAAAAEYVAVPDVHEDGGNYRMEDPWLLEWC